MNVIPIMRPRQRGTVHVPAVTLAHGGGGKAMKDLIDDVFVAAFDNPLLAPLDDQARVDIAALARHGRSLAFTTDSYVVLRSSHPNRWHPRADKRAYPPSRP
jgi:hydrogenase expression/formation protein HypE